MRVRAGLQAIRDKEIPFSSNIEIYASINFPNSNFMHYNFIHLRYRNPQEVHYRGRHEWRGDAGPSNDGRSGTYAEY